MLAIRRVTQDNQGKKASGVDGKSSLTPKERILLTARLRIDGKSDNVKRVYLPKKGSCGSKRPIGIPTIQDRAKQSLVLLALEPEWEAKFEPNSYGFRPGRSCHDAINAIYLGINKVPKYILDADIAECFDKIDHEALLIKLDTFPKFKKQIKAWLKAGILDSLDLKNPTAGTPQGGVISPLLCNIALHGLEKHLKS